MIISSRVDHRQRPQDGANRRGVGVNELQRQRDQLVVARLHVVEHQVLEHAQVVRQQLLMAVERLAVGGIDRLRVDADQPHAQAGQPHDGLGRERAELGDHSVGARGRSGPARAAAGSPAACARCSGVISGPLSMAWMTRHGPRNGSGRRRRSRCASAAVVQRRIGMRAKMRRHRDGARH